MRLALANALSVIGHPLLALPAAVVAGALTGSAAGAAVLVA